MLDSTAVISISELNRRARLSLEREFPLLWVAGEISNLTRAASGHIYFSLKDEVAQARCVMFRSRANSIPWRLENGQQVEAHVLVSLYELRGDFQLNIETLRRAGLGRLFEAFARLKARLEAEGLFAAERKRPLPRFPNRIGIISSPGAAALRDVLVTLKRRAPHLQVVLYPVPVQGDSAADAIVRAITVAGQRDECSLLLIVRGGGSIEDLWAFNEEVVARAIAASTLPIISGVGHETDTTITDHVADLRAATPTAAAELATQGWHEAAGEIADLETALSRATQYRVAREQQRLDHLSLRLVHPATRMTQARDRLALLGSQLDASLARGLGRHRDRLNRAALGLERNVPSTERCRGNIGLLAQRLGSAIREQHRQRLNALDKLAAALTHLNPEATLARGFSIVRDASGNLVTDASSLHAGQTVRFHLARGSAEAAILASSPDQSPVAT
ncbi:MAG: exodeoxyribonuclease VII large subunit [Rugosibacter sp.]|nr:exodeoxyribonuclease VII large subunit [Rugosibacter sp.]